MVKYVRYCNPIEGIPMYAITMFRTDHGNWLVEVSPCDSYGHVISDPVVWDIFSNWWSAKKFVRKQYKEFYRYVNEGR